MSQKASRDILRWSQQVASLKSVPLDVGQDIADEIDQLRDTQYSRGKDPYGRKWKKRKHRYSWPILDRTGHLRSSVRTRVQGRTVSVQTHVSYAGYVQAIRKVVPEGEMPKQWASAIDDIVIDAIEDRLK